jgi:hypothetical protein
MQKKTGASLEAPDRLLEAGCRIERLGLIRHLMSR